MRSRRNQPDRIHPGREESGLILSSAAGRWTRRRKRWPSGTARRASRCRSMSASTSPPSRSRATMSRRRSVARFARAASRVSG
jgi:hypothetical protein